MQQDNNTNKQDINKTIADITPAHIIVDDTAMPIEQYVRAYIEEIQNQQELDKKKTKEYSPSLPIEYEYNRYLVFDTETYVNTQELRIGYAILYNPAKPVTRLVYKDSDTQHQFPEKFMVASPEKIFCFYDPALLSAEEQELFLSYQFSEELRPHLTGTTIAYMTVEKFIDVFYKLIYDRGYYKKNETITCIGHNLPYDITRLAKSWNDAGGDMLGGFTMRLCSCTLGIDKKTGKTYTTCYKHPNLRLKKLASHKHFIKFERRKSIQGQPPNTFEGRFINTDMLAKALLGAGVGLSLKYLTTKIFDVPLPKRDTEDIDYAASLTPQFLEYSLQDVIATHYLYERLLQLYQKHGCSTDVAKIFSEASLGKAYFKDLGIKPFLQKHKDFPKEVLGYGLQAYYGGRSEINVRLFPTEIVYTDFKSQYPSANALMALQDIILAERVTVEDVTIQTQELLDTITVDDLQNPATWRKLRVLVQLKPDFDMLPVRTDFGKSGDWQRNIAISPVQSDIPVWYTLADIIASKLLLQKTPVIMQAIEIVPHGKYRTGEKAMMGDKNYKLAPAKYDMFTQVINLRTVVKKKAKVAEELSKDDSLPLIERAEKLQEKMFNDNLQLALKLLANSTSYGVLVEVVKTTYSKSHPVRVYADTIFEDNSKSVEKNGLYFCGPLGAFIPASGRLLLAIAQRLGLDRGLIHAFCDTDSISYTALNALPYPEMVSRVKDILHWFKPLYPYDDDGELLEMEDINYDFRDYRDEHGKKVKKLYPLKCLAVSTKRYCVYNKLENGELVIRKFTAHGTGTWSQPEKYTSPDYIPLPHTYKLYENDASMKEQEKKAKAYADIGGRNYVYDLWYSVIETIENAGEQEDIEMLVSANEKTSQIRDLLKKIPAFHQLTISSTTLLSHFEKTAGDKLTTRPFNFITVYPALRGTELMSVTFYHGDEIEYDNLKKTGFYTPFTRNVEMKRTHLRRLDGHGEVNITPPSLDNQFSEYFENEERKFAGDTGVLKRRRLIVTKLHFTGKESNTYERQLAEELNDSLPNKKVQEEEEIYKTVDGKNLLENIDVKILKKHMEGDTTNLYKIKNGDISCSHDLLLRIQDAINIATKEGDNVYMQDNVPTKKCKLCELELPVTQYQKEKKTKDGYRAVCKACRKIKSE